MSHRTMTIKRGTRVRKSDDYRDPATEGEIAYDTEYARRVRQSMRVAEEIEKRLQQIASEEVAATTRNDQAKLRELALESDQLEAALVRLHIARHGGLGELEAAGNAGLAKAEAFQRTGHADDIAQDGLDEALVKKDTALKKAIRDPLGLGGAFGLQYEYDE